MSTDYQTRAKQYDLATPEEIRAALAKPDTVLLDVRNETEVAEQGKLDRSIQTTCTAEDCVALRAGPEDYVKDKNATIVIHCRSGRRK